jgi:hypothetical protein
MKSRHYIWCDWTVLCNAGRLIFLCAALVCSDRGGVSEVKGEHCQED